jgi:hypothetical protein
MCAKRTTDTDASNEETTRCRQRVLSLCNTYGIELTHLDSYEFDNVWTTTRVGSVWDAVLAVSRKLLDNGTAFVHTLRGFEIEIRGGNVFALDGQTRACAETPSGTKMSLYNCNPDDPWTRNNFIHEFGHILIHRAGGILGNWERIQQQFDASVQTDILFDNPFRGFALRENTFTITSSDFANLSEGDQSEYRQTRITEDVADMFLNWVVGGFPADDEVGPRRTEFAEGKPSKFDDGTQIKNIGMAGWAVQAGKFAGRPCSAAAQASLYAMWLVSLVGDQCLNMPAI